MKDFNDLRRRVKYGSKKIQERVSDGVSDSVTEVFTHLPLRSHYPHVSDVPHTLLLPQDTRDPPVSVGENEERKDVLDGGDEDERVAERVADRVEEGVGDSQNEELLGEVL